MIRDIQLQADGDVSLVGGDISYGESTRQHQADILQASRGDYINAPLIGVNAINYLLDEKPQAFLQEVARQMTLDGIKVKKVSFENEELVISGGYEN